MEPCAKIAGTMGYYDTARVCLNGHMVNTSYHADAGRAIVTPDTILR
jgi:hypothetical protein